MKHQPSHLLLIDSDAPLRARISAALAAAPSLAGCTISEAPDAAALESLLSAGISCDLVLTGLTINGLSGRAIIARLRQSLPDIPIILLADPEDVPVAASVTADTSVVAALKTAEGLPLLPGLIRAVLSRQNAAEVGAPDERRIFTHSRVPQLLVDPDTLNVIDANPAASALTGHDHAELVGRPLASLMHRPQYDIEEKLRRAAAEGADLVCQHRLISGEVRDMELTVDPIDHEGRRLLYVVIYDVTARLLAQRALEQSEERFRRIAENAPDMIFRWSYARGFEYVSSASTDVIGYTPEEHYSDPGLSYRSIHIDDLPVYESVFSDLADPEGPRRYCVIRWYHKDGHLVHVEMRMTPIFDEFGNLIAIEGIARDISQHVRAQARLRELTGRLTRAHEEERHRIAHELHDEIGQALTIAKMRVRLVDGVLPADAEAARDRLGALVQQVEETLQSVRALSHGLRPPLLSEMGLDPALESLCDGFSQNSGLTVTFSHEGAGDDRLPYPIELTVFRVVQEALTNVVRHARASQAVVTLRHLEDGLHLTITDNGQGFNLSALAQTERPNVGLGLLGMRERVDAMDGSLQIETAEGQGTRIEVHLPRVVKEQEESGL